jgi:hypothetical protein
MSETGSTFLTLSQVSARTGRHPELLRQWCASGRIPCQRLGGSWVLREEDLPLLDGIATRARRTTPQAKAEPVGQRVIAAVFDDAARAAAAAEALRLRLQLEAEAIETSSVGLRSLGALGLTVVAGTFPAASALQGRRIIGSYGGRVVADVGDDNGEGPAIPHVAARDSVSTGA